MCRLVSPATGFGAITVNHTCDEDWVAIATLSRPILIAFTAFVFGFPAISLAAEFGLVGDNGLRSPFARVFAWAIAFPCACYFAWVSRGSNHLIALHGSKAKFSFPFMPWLNRIVDRCDIGSLEPHGPTSGLPVEIIVNLRGGSRVRPQLGSTVEDFDSILAALEQWQTDVSD